MKLKYFYSLGLFVMASLLLTSCIKNKVEPLGNAGETFIKIDEAPEKTMFFSPFTGVKKVDLFTVRRDVPSNAELNTTTTVKLTAKPSLVTAYNTANGTNFELLPDSLYTLTDPSMKESANVYKLTYNDGDFAKTFSIQLNGSKWDLSHKYALGFSITDSSGKNLSEGKKDVLVMISVKNQWDGVYEVTGTLTDLVVPTITGEYPLNWDLVTAGPNKIIVYDKDYTGTPTHIINSGGSLSQYGSFGLVLTIDPNTNKVTEVVNFYGQPAGNGRSAALDPAFDNRYDPATKTFHMRYYILQPGTNIRTIFEETWKYTGAR